LRNFLHESCSNQTTIHRHRAGGAGNHHLVRQFYHCAWYCHQDSTCFVGLLSLGDGFPHHVAIGLEKIRTRKTGGVAKQAAYYSPAINLALIGTTSSPVFAIALAAIFLNEKITPLRITGLLICIAGIVYLIAQGSWEKLKAFHFSVGDVLILLGAFSFAVYNILVRKKAKGISPMNFLFVVFTAGTILLIPFFLWEVFTTPAVTWSGDLLLIILYLGAGTSVIAFLCWNVAISRLGAARTALFGNLIPLFAALEAVWLLGEKITAVHIIGGITIIAGLVIANLKK
jgi:drug/metabolite transporter (DMT)-like permease